MHQPYYKFADAAVTITPYHANLNPQTFTASSAIFSSDWEGEEIEFTDDAGTVHHIEFKAYLSGTTFTGALTLRHQHKCICKLERASISSRHGLCSKLLLSMTRV